MSDDLGILDRQPAGQLGLQRPGDHQPCAPFTDRASPIGITQVTQSRRRHLAKPDVDVRGTIHQHLGQQQLTFVLQQP